MLLGKCIVCSQWIQGLGEQRNPTKYSEHFVFDLCCQTVKCWDSYLAPSNECHHPSKTRFWWLLFSSECCMRFAAFQVL